MSFYPHHYATKVNMALAPLRWTPEVWQMRRFVNPARLNSLWLGTAWNLFLLPTRLWHEFGAILITGRVGLALKHLLIAIPGSALQFAWWGITGRLRAHNLDLDIVVTSRFLTEQECAQAIRLGKLDLVRKAGAPRGTSC